MKPAENGPEPAMREHKGSTAIDTVAVELGIDPRRIKGWIYQGYTSIRYPIGDVALGLVDRESLDAFLKRRAADQPTVIPGA